MMERRWFLSSIYLTFHSTMAWDDIDSWRCFFCVCHLLLSSTTKTISCNFLRGFFTHTIFFVLSSTLLSASDFFFAKRIRAKIRLCSISSFFFFLTEFENIFTYTRKGWKNICRKYKLNLTRRSLSLSRSNVAGKYARRMSHLIAILLNLKEFFSH